MLRMQARRAKDEDTKEALRRAVSRILGISQIHDILASQSGDKIDMDILLDKITKLSVDSLALLPVNVVRENQGVPLSWTPKRRCPWPLRPMN